MRMLKSLKRIHAVAALTATDGLRQPSFFFLVIAASTLIALSPCFAFFHLGEEVKMVVDLGLSTILAISTLLALLTSSVTLSDEIENRTALTMLSKPLRREEFLLGKFLGVVVTTSALILLIVPTFLVTIRGQKFVDTDEDPNYWFGILFSLCAGLFIFSLLFVTRMAFHRGISLVKSFWVAYGVSSLVLLLSLPWHTRADHATWEWHILMGLFFIALHGWVISAMAVTLATQFTLVQSAIGTTVFFIVGHAAGGLLSSLRDTHGEWSIFGSILRTILPDLDQFNLVDSLAISYMAKPVQIPWDVLGGSVAYALLYGIALLAIAAGLFSRRELA